MKKTGSGTGKGPVLALCFVAFILYSMYFNGFGTNSPAIMGFFGIDEAANGLILTVQALGCIAMTVLLGLFGERLNKISGIAWGLLVMGAGGVLVGLIPVLSPNGGYLLMMAFSLVAGIGFTTIDLLMNGLVADVFPERKNTLLPFVHGFYGLGAMLAPVFVTAVVEPSVPSQFARPYLAIGAAALCAFVLMALAGRRARAHTPYADMSAIRARARSNPAEVFADLRAWLYLLVCLMFQAFQLGLTTWFPGYCREVLSFSYENSALMLTLYFLGILAMRFVSPLIYKKISVRLFYIATVASSSVLFLLFLFIRPSLGLSGALIAIIGFLHGSAVPSQVILCCDTFPQRTASASSILLFAVSTATFVVPAALGRVIGVSGYLPPMLIITACLVLSVLFLLPIARMRGKDGV
jgi:fucose permease